VLQITWEQQCNLNTTQQRKGNPHSCMSVMSGAGLSLCKQSARMQVTSPIPADRLPLISCGYLPSFRESSSFGRYQIMLLGDKSTWLCVSGLPVAVLDRARRAVGEYGTQARDPSITNPTL